MAPLDGLGVFEFESPFGENLAQQGLVVPEEDGVDIEAAALGDDADLETLAGPFIHLAEHGVRALDDGIRTYGDAHFRDLAGP